MNTGEFNQETAPKNKFLTAGEQRGGEPIRMRRRRKYKKQKGGQDG